MKGTKIKRGRPKKEKEEVPSAVPNNNESIAFVNKRFIDKDGHICTVMYSGCKAKPIDIRYN